MKTPATRFEILINGKRISDATVNLEDQLEVNLVTLPGQDSAVLAVTAFIPEDGNGENYVRSEDAVVRPGDSLTITLSAASSAGESVATSVTPRVPEQEEDSADARVLTCSFCNKSQHEVLKLIAGPYSVICDECIAFCQQVISDEK